VETAWWALESNATMLQLQTMGARVTAK